MKFTTLAAMVEVQMPLALFITLLLTWNACTWAFLSFAHMCLFTLLCAVLWISLMLGFLVLDIGLIMMAFAFVRAYSRLFVR
jgi:hypothetical protein